MLSTKDIAVTIKMAKDSKRPISAETYIKHIQFMMDEYCNKKPQPDCEVSLYLTKISELAGDIYKLSRREF